MDEEKKEGEVTSDETQATVEEGTPETSVEENKVPYSRFKNIHERYKEAEQEAAYWKAQAEELESRNVEKEEYHETGELPAWWKRLYGDTSESKEGYAIWKENNPTLSREDIRQEALQAYQEVQRSETRRIAQNLESIDEKMDDLSVYVGRDLTEQEQADVLDIMDEYTPQDEDGYYIGQVFPAEKAWEIYELKNASDKAGKKQSRDKVASLISSESRGEPSPIQTQSDKNFDPRISALSSALEKRLKNN